MSTDVTSREDLLARLKAIAGEIWRSWSTTYAGKPVESRERARQLTKDEWEFVQSVMREGIVIVRPVNCQMGFGFGLVLYEIPADPVYPGVPRDKPREVLMIEGAHLSGKYEGFSTAWDQMSPFSHNASNGALLLEYFKERLESKSHYNY